MALTEIKTNGIADDAVTTDKLANAINTERTANTAKVQTSINNNADNRIITGSGTANTLNGEAGLTWNGSLFQIDTSGVGDCFRIGTASGADTAIRVGSTGTNVDTHGVIKYDIDDNYFSFLVSGESHGSGGVYIENGGKVRLPAGVKLGGSADANLLDDYEEGTFTPDWNGSSAGTTTYSTNNGSYTKIGNLVHVRIYSGINGTTGTGAWRMTNLPFASPNSTSHITTGSCMLDGLNFNSSYSWVVPYKNSNSNDLDLYASGDNLNWSQVQVSDDSSFAIILGITYAAA